MKAGASNTFFWQYGGLEISENKYEKQTISKKYIGVLSLITSNCAIAYWIS